MLKTAEEMIEDYEREKKWASSMITVGDSMVTCLICGEHIEESNDGVTMTLTCPNGHELSLRTVHSNN